MAKTPVLGLVKTRLGRELGPAHATRVFRATAAAVLGRLTRDPRFETRLAIAPDQGVAARAFAIAIPRMKQGHGDLGARLQRAADRAPPGPVVIIGTDIPSISTTHIAEAFRALRNHDAVFGPAEDGGYWLVGFKRFPTTPRAFANIRWSHAETLADTLRNLARYHVATVATLSDIDTSTDVRRLSRHIGRHVLPIR